MSPEEFQNEFGSEFTQETAASAPYGMNPHRPVKTGLTQRGKVGIAVVTAVIAGGGLLGYNHYATQQAEQANKAQELALKQQELRIQELKVMGQQAAANQKTATSQAAAFQAKVDACVKANKTLVGKQLGATLRSVVDDCKAQYEASAASGDDMLAAASSTDTSGGGGGLNSGLLIGAGVLAAGLIFTVKKNTKSNPA